MCTRWGGIPCKRKKSGIREFREKLTTFLEASGPVAITRHGETVGYYIPAHASKKAPYHLAALRTATAQLDALLTASGASKKEELVNDFKEARRQRSEGSNLKWAVQNGSSSSV